MAQLVDYAGLFPPAALDMPEAVAEYAGFQNQQEVWMLGRFIVPAGRLPELASAGEALMSPSRPWGVSALVGHREDAELSLAQLPAQCEAIKEFERGLKGRAAVEVLEIPIPAQLEPAGLSGFLSDFLDVLDHHCLDGRDVFWEIPPGASDETMAAFLATLSTAAVARSGAGKTVQRLGAKLRCGGVTAEAFPSVQRIALVVAHCRDLGLALKCTAGLHHPLRHQATEPAVMMHGFLNVFGAGLLAHAYGWNAEKLSEVISDTSPESFVFDADTFRWRGHSVEAGTLRQLRAQFLCGFGSCSFDEPRDDLQNLGLLSSS